MEVLLLLLKYLRSMVAKMRSVAASNEKRMKDRGRKLIDFKSFPLSCRPFSDSNLILPYGRFPFQAKVMFLQERARNIANHKWNLFSNVSLREAIRKVYTWCILSRDASNEVFCSSSGRSSNMLQTMALSRAEQPFPVCNIALIKCICGKQWRQ